MPRPFYLGLNMTGTVSVGAYTAGVIDFLVEAMDAWYAERERQKKEHGDDYSAWTIPPHELQLTVMAGASGGGITSALTASALAQNFAHVRKQKAADNQSLNTLFQSWVIDIDISKLLGHLDLNGNPKKVVSLLDSTPIQDIAGKVFTNRKPSAVRRAWVRDGLKVILTLTNLRGIPYALEPQTDPDSARVLYYADRQDFAVVWDQIEAGKNTVRLNPGTTDYWQSLGQAAMATSAFPAFLAPQRLERRAAEFNHRGWRIAEDDPKCGPDGVCACESNQEMPPAWSLDDDSLFETFNVDGGVTNNSPVDCVRLELAGLDPVMPSGHNLRDPERADRAVINIAPLAVDLDPGLPPWPSDSLLSLPGQLIQVLLNQSRIQGENLKLTSDGQVASRWIISPTSETAGAEPLAGATLGAFGGFVAQPFREHDYQLGRRNCQRFLTHHFGIPWSNEWLREYPLAEMTRARLDAEYGFPAAAGPKDRLCPLIPLMQAVRPEVVVVREKVHRSALEPLADLALDRVRRVAFALLAESGKGWLSRAAVEVVWLLLRHDLRDKLLTYAGRELASKGFLN